MDKESIFFPLLRVKQNGLGELDNVKGWDRKKKTHVPKNWDFNLNHHFFYYNVTVKFIYIYHDQLTLDAIH